MLQWIAKIYCNPTALFMANGILSEPFPITNGARQGCPLSPLLLSLSLEPFFCQVRLNPDITWLTVGGVQHKIPAYTDYMLLSMTIPAVSLPNLLQEIQTLWGTLQLEDTF